VSGILNGIDTSVWDPAADTALAGTYAATTKGPERDAARRRNKAAVFERAGFERVALEGAGFVDPSFDDTVPLAVMVTRLTGQKGADMLLPIVPVLKSIPLRVVVLGSGEASIAAGLRAAAEAYPAWFAFVEGYDDAFAHALFGAGDLYLMPSRFEPCGLAQMQAMRYGAIPVVTDVGGLHDTVVDADEHRDGTGFVAHEPSPVAFTSALFRAARRLSNGRQRQSMISRIMKLDWSWRSPARQYIELYERLAAHHRPRR
jgi:starch synthase